MQSGPKNTAKILTLDRCGDRAGGPSFLRPDLARDQRLSFFRAAAFIFWSSRVRAIHQAETNFD